MKFFSNEKESADDGRDRTDVVTSDPVPVPQQRTGSPWADAPGGADEKLADAERRDDPEEARSRIAEDRDRVEEDGGRVEEDGGRVGDTARPDALDDAQARPTAFDDTPERPEAVDDAERPEALDNAPERPEALDDSLTRPGVETAGDAPDAASTTYGPHDTVADPNRPAATTTDDAAPLEDAPLKDDGTFDDPQAVNPATDESPAGTTTGSTMGENAAAPVAAADDTVTDGDTASEKAPSDANVAAPVVAAVPAEAVSATAAAPAPDRLFTDGDSFADRFREIQLRFVDDPKQATAEAATLVGEAVETLTSTLQGQKNRLAGGSDDTEHLRVELRGYRDLMNRLLAL